MSDADSSSTFFFLAFGSCRGRKVKQQTKSAQRGARRKGEKGGALRTTEEQTSRVGATPVQHQNVTVNAL